MSGVRGSCMVNNWLMHGEHDDSFVGIDLAEDPGPEPVEHLSFLLMRLLGKNNLEPRPMAMPHFILALGEAILLPVADAAHGKVPHSYCS